MLMRSAARGFTMVEAMVTLSVLALLIALAVPSMSDYLRSTQVRGTAESVMHGLNKARNEAMKRNQVVTFWLVSPQDAAALDDGCQLSSSSASWVVSLDDPSLACASDPSPSEAPRIVETFAAGTTGAALTVRAYDATGAAPATSVSFNGFGQIDRNSGATPLGRIEVRHADASARRLRIQISSTGSVRLCDLDVEATDPRACPA